MRARGENIVIATLRRQGITNPKVKKQRSGGGKKITDKDITFFTRQLATMMKAGVPLLQAFDIVGKGHSNPSVRKLLLDIKTEVETGSSLAQAFRKYPLYFDACSATWSPRASRPVFWTPCWTAWRPTRKRSSPSRARSRRRCSTRSRSSWWRFIVTAVIMIFVIPAVQGAVQELRRGPARADADRDDHVGVFRRVLVHRFSAVIGGGVWFFFYTWKRSEKMQIVMDRLMLRMPVFGDMIRKATIARWTPHAVDHVRRRRAAG